MSARPARARCAAGLCLWLLLPGCAVGGAGPDEARDADVDLDASSSNGQIVDAEPGADPADAATGDPADGGLACDPCRLVEQCGCDDPATPACDLGGASPASGTTACRAVLWPGTSTDTCHDASDCAAGFVCLGPSAGEASCKRYCASDLDCDGGGSVCVIEVTAGGQPIPGVKVCSPDCDPFTQAGCPDTWACGAYSDPSEQRSFTWCQVPGEGGHNAACRDDGQCAAGFTCVHIGESAKCKRYCDQGDGEPGCPSFQQCLTLVDAAGTPLVVAGVAYGVCN